MSARMRYGPLGVASLALAAAVGFLTPGTGGAQPAASGQPSMRTVADVQPMARSSASYPCDSSARACLDLSRHEAWLADGNGHVTYGPVAARGGSKHAATPTGTFQVLWKDRDHWSKEFDAPMPYSVFFYPGDAFHAGSTGAYSNGCVHLSSTSAKRFFNSLQYGDTVQIVK